MTENDYIAEYIKEKHPKLLGIDFAFWKLTKKVSNAVSDMVNVFRKYDTQEIKEHLEKVMEGKE